jgi:hypothetical protein
VYTAVHFDRCITIASIERLVWLPVFGSARQDRAEPLSNPVGLIDHTFKKEHFMTTLQELKPQGKVRVLDAVKAAGVDVEDWEHSASGATNPAYCYEWAFVEAGKVAVLNAWFSSMHEAGSRIEFRGNMRDVSRHEKNSQRRERAKKFDKIVREAFLEGLSVRVVILDGGGPGDIYGHAKRRVLDTEQWAVESYAPNGDFVVVRGAAPGRYVDQFSLTKSSDSEPSRREVSGQIFDRDPVVRQNVLNIAKGRCQLCNRLGFVTWDGRYYLESHHVIPLSEGGPDEETNVVALCPNHHREAHFGQEREKLRDKLGRVAAGEESRFPSKGRNDDLLGSERAWWQTADALNEAADVLEAWVVKGDFTGKQKVGCFLLENTVVIAFSHRWRRRLVALMLYAFAVENWLKGILVAECKRGSPVTYEQIQLILEERVDPDLTVAECFRAASAVLNEPDVQAIQKRYLSQKATEDSERAEAAMKHKTHDLARLAVAAGIRLDAGERAYLDALSYIVQIGRYPAHGSQENVDLQAVVENQRAKPSLNRLIGQRWAELQT